jgi:hypothetical protein
MESRNSRVACTLTALLLVGLAFASIPVAFAASSSYNNVQVLVTPSSNLNYNYFFTAYNLTGQLVASSQTPYPAAAFELPSGTYLFTVSAVNQTSYGCPLCVEGIAKGAAAASPSNTSSSNGTSPNGGTVLPPIMYRPPAAEYGYQIEQVTGSDTINIATQNITKIPTASVDVKVSFVNGTAASGAWVSSSVVGEWYYWWGSDSNIVMWAQTGQDGVAHLVLPEAPTVVSAWDWVKVDLPVSQTSTKVDVGGETVNVTIYWEPTYVGLAASALIIPPTSSVSLKLHYQTPNFWVMPMGASVAPGTPGMVGGAAVSNDATGVPSGTQQAAQQGSNPYYLPTSIPSLQTVSGAQGSSLGMTPAITTLIEGAAIGAAAVAAVAFAVMRSRKAAV